MNSLEVDPHKSLLRDGYSIHFSGEDYVPQVSPKAYVET